MGAQFSEHIQINPASLPHDRLLRRHWCVVLPEDYFEDCRGFQEWPPNHDRQYKQKVEEHVSDHDPGEHGAPLIPTVQDKDVQSQEVPHFDPPRIEDDILWTKLGVEIFECEPNCKTNVGEVEEDGRGVGQDRREKENEHRLSFSALKERPLEAGHCEPEWRVGHDQAPDLARQEEGTRQQTPIFAFRENLFAAETEAIAIKEAEVLQKH
jgi:hypothetical protein